MLPEIQLKSRHKTGGGGGRFLGETAQAVFPDISSNSLKKLAILVEMFFFTADFGGNHNYKEIKSKPLDFRLEKIRIVTNECRDSKNI
jgi:hypothetical protein